MSHLIHICLYNSSLTHTSLPVNPKCSALLCYALRTYSCMSLYLQENIVSPFSCCEPGAWLASAVTHAHAHTHTHKLNVCIDCRSLEQAFKDLRGLMAKAAEMVELAERFRATMAAQQKQAQQGTGVRALYLHWLDLACRKCQITCLRMLIDAPILFFVTLKLSTLVLIQYKASCCISSFNNALGKNICCVTSTCVVQDSHLPKQVCMDGH